MKLPQKILERKLFKEGYQSIISIDEVGIGALAGPVVVCAIKFDSNFIKKNLNLRGLRDSKLLSASQRAEFAKELTKDFGSNNVNFRFQISYCQPKTIDRLNIYQASRLAMRRAVQKVIYDSRITNNKHKLIVLVDGKYEIKGVDLRQIAIVGGDRSVFSIAVASILAKVYRDKMMCKYAKKFPQYGFEKHKGYGTAEHLTKLRKYGSCYIHRESFNPVRGSSGLRVL